MKVEVALYRSIGYTLRALAKELCDCGNKHEPDPADHATLCPYLATYEADAGAVQS